MTNNKIITLLLTGALTGVLSQKSVAAGWEPPRDTFQIQTSSTNGIAQQSGSSANLQGTVTWIGAPTDTTGSVWGNWTDASHARQTLNDLLAQDGLVMHAYFPDMTTEVTSNLITTVTHNQLSFQYATPPLNAANLNELIIVLSNTDQQLLYWQTIQTKIQVRIVAIQALIAQLEVKKKIPVPQITNLQNLIVKLQNTYAKLAQKILNKTTNVAEEQFSLQVDNQVANNSFNSLVIFPFRYSVSYDIGSAIQGESTNAHGLIIRLPADPGVPDAGGAKAYTPKFYWNGNLVSSLPLQTIAVNGQVEFDYPIGPLSPSDLNRFTVQMVGRADKTDSGKEWPTTWWQSYNFDNHYGGALSLNLPVVVDGVAPTWLAGWIPNSQQEYFSATQQFSATLQDAFGLVDPTAFEAAVSGTATDGTTVSQDISSSLSLNSPDEGQTYQVSGTFGSLPDGFYTLSLSGANLAGGSSAPDPLQTVFRLDTTAPLVTLSQNGSSCTNQGASNFTVTIQDFSPITNTVVNNGTQIIQNTASPSSLNVGQTYSFPVQASLNPGQNSFDIASTDAAGNVTTLTGAVQVFYAQSPPTITLGSSDNIFTNQQTFSLPISVSDPTSTTQVFQNGNLITTSQGSFTVTATLGPLNNTFTIQSVDCGGTATASLNSIFFDSTPPTIATGSSIPQLTANSSFTFPVTVTDETPVSTVVSLNGNQITQSSQSSFSVSATLQEGANAFVLVSTDAAGNQSTSQISIVLNNIPPQITLGVNDGVLTDKASFSFPVTVVDASSVSTTVSQNGAQIAQSTQNSFTAVATLAQGVNTFQIVSIDAAGNQSTAQLNSVTLDTSPPSITIGANSNQVTRTPAFVIPITVTDKVGTTTTVSQNGAQIAQSTQASFSVSANLLQGNNSFVVTAVDAAGNQISAQLNGILLDNVAPIITLGQPDNQLTRYSAFSLPITIVDLANVTTTVFQNGNEVMQTTQPNFSASIILQEGINVIQITSIDQAGNESSAQLSSISLDNIPPALSKLLPAASAVVSTLTFPVSGSANEPLLSASLNGVPVTLSPDGMSFSGNFTAVTSGPVSLKWQVSDLAGNTTAQTVSVEVLLNVLNGNLISVAPAPDNIHLNVIGAAGAALPGVTVSASGSLLNSGSAVAAADGSFTIQLSAFTQATVSATDPRTGNTNTATVSWGSAAGTLLSGRVQDINQNPLANAKVSIASSGLSTTTDGNGIFTFSQPVTGDQTVVVDGSTVTQNPNSPLEKFGVVYVNVNIGVTQSNVLPRPIYMAPVFLDGSATSVTAASGASVTDTHASGVTLSIPAGAAMFPGGASGGQISMIRVPASVTTIQPPAFASPTTVVDLEPSGTTFATPVDLTLPNDNNLAPGVNLVIMSYNSRTGSWELDGAAQVTSDGGSVKTKPGMGITHFSAVYAVPAAPQARAISGEDHPGTDGFNGYVGTTINLPSFKSLGNSVSPSLIYRSTWAKPSVVMSNLIDVPFDQITATQTSTQSGSGSYSYVSCYASGFLGLDETCNNNIETYYYSTLFTDAVQSYITPNFVTAQFTTAGIQSAPAIFRGVPNQAVVSFGLQLQQTNPSTNATSYLSSGIYPYSAKYSLALQNVTVSTQTATTYTSLSPTPYVQTLSSTSIQAMGQIFPSDLAGNLYVENEIASPAGMGWRIGGVQKIAGVGQNRLYIEEASGAISPYALNSNTLSTLANNPNFSGGGGFGTWPMAYADPNIPQWSPSNSCKVTHSDGTEDCIPYFGQITGYDLDSGTAVQTYNATTDGYEYLLHVVNGAGHIHYLEPHPNVNSVISLPDGRVFASDALGAIHMAPSGSNNFTPLAGRLSTETALSVMPSEFVSSSEGDANDPDNYCVQNFGTYCPYEANLPQGDVCSGTSCGVPPNVSQGSIFLPYFSDGPTLLGTAFGPTPAGFNPMNPPANNVQVGSGNVCNIDPVLCPIYHYANQGFGIAGFNNTMTIIPGFIPNTLVVADTGNNRVRIIDLTNQFVLTIAGNGSNIDTVNTQGLLAGLYHPRGLAYDSLGNLYISTENGYIRKVDPSGYMTNFAGAPATQGGILADSTLAQNALFVRPYGLAFDNTNGYLYVADTGNNRIVQVSVATGMANTIAGNGNAGTVATAGNDDNKPALNASLSSPTYITLDPQNNVVFFDSANQRIRRITFNATTVGVVGYGPALPDNTTLTQNSDHTFTRTYRNGTKVYFDQNGNETSSVDRLGRTVTYFYTGAGNLASIKDPTGRVTQYNYSESNLASITDPAGRVTSFGYNGSNQLIRANFPDGSNKQYQYDINGLMLAEADQLGNPTGYTYNAYDRISMVTRADGSTVTVNDVASSTAANNYTQDSPGQLQSSTEVGGTLSNTVTDSNGSTSSFAPDFNGMIVQVTDALGQTTKVARDGNANPLQITRPDGSTITNTFDPKTQDLLSTTDSSTGIVTSMTYDSFGNLLTTTNGKGLTGSSTYDPNTGLLLQTADPLGHGITYAYNNMGLPTAMKNSLGLGVTNTYDTYGDKLTATDTAGHTSTYTYDGAGNVLSATNANHQTTRYTYDSFNRMLTVTTPKSETTSYSYLPTGQLAQVKDALGNTVTYSYNSLGQLIQKMDQLGYISTYAYDANGNLTLEVDPNGNHKSYTYDVLNRLVKKTLPDDTISMSYDSRNEVTQITNVNSALSYTYNGGRLMSARSQGLGAFVGIPAATLSFTWDNDGNRIAMTDPMGATSYGFDNADRMTGLTNAIGESYSFAIDAANRMTTAWRPGSQTQFSYDNASFVTAILHSSGGTPVVSFNYQRDNIGNITSIQTGAGVNRTLAYDADSQLMAASNPEAPTTPLQSESFTYDGIGNRTQDEGGSYSFDPHSVRLVQDYNNLYGYDSNGNLITKQALGIMAGTVTQYTYTSQNQLSGFKVFPPGALSSSPSKVVMYAYDAKGRRIQKVVLDNTAPSDPTKTFTRRYVYDGGKIDLEYDGNNNVLARYTNRSGGDAALSVSVTQAGVNVGLAQTAGSYFYIKDIMGSVTDVLDNNGNHVQHYVYSAFGSLLEIENGAGINVTTSPPLSTSYGFTGRELDSESGMMYFRARYYDPNSGRFVQADPSPGKVGVPISMTNGYTYGGNAPFSHTDPSGQSIFGDLFGWLASPITALASVTASVASAAGSAFLDFVSSPQFRLAAVMIAVTVASGGAGAAVAAGMESALGGALVGAAVGAGVGAVVGAIGYTALGLGPWWKGALMGAITGAVAGGFAGASGVSNTPQTGGTLSTGSGGSYQVATSDETLGFKAEPWQNTWDNEYLDGPDFRMVHPDAIPNSTPGVYPDTVWEYQMS